MQPNGMIFWDWNGTLMDDVDFTHGCLNWMLESHGYPQRYDLAQYREMAVFTQFSSDLDEATQSQLKYGQSLMQILRQGRSSPMSSAEQIITLVCAMGKIYQPLPLPQILPFQKLLLEAFHTRQGALLARPEFMRVHRSYIVNMLQAEKLSPAGVITFSGHNVPVSRLLYGQLQKDYLALLFSGRDA